MRGMLFGLLFALAHFACLAQSLKDTLRSPYDPRGDGQTWGLKGKALPFPLGDDLGLAALVGAEYGFLKHHSIGVDGSILYIGGTYDAFTDTAGVEHPDGGRRWSTDKAVFINYRCYLGFHGWRDRGWAPYVGAFYRYGTVNGAGDAEYDHDDVEFHETHISGGPLVGVLLRASDETNVGIDMNIGAYLKHIDAVHYDQVGDVRLAENTSREFYGVRVGLNVYFWFFRR